VVAPTKRPGNRPLVAAPRLPLLIGRSEMTIDTQEPRRAAEVAEQHAREAEANVREAEANALVAEANAREDAAREGSDDEAVVVVVARP